MPITGMVPFLKVNVSWLIVEESIFSLKVTVILVFIATFTARLDGLVEMTRGGVVSGIMSGVGLDLTAVVAGGLIDITVGAVVSAAVALAVLAVTGLTETTAGAIESVPGIGTVLPVECGVAAAVGREVLLDWQLQAAVSMRISIRKREVINLSIICFLILTSICRLHIQLSCHQYYSQALCVVNMHYGFGSNE